MSTLLLVLAAATAGAHSPAALTPEHAGPRTLATAPDQFVRLNGVTLRYKVFGGGEPMVLLHGYTDRIETWGRVADSLATEFQVIAPDLRGFGESTELNRPEDYGQRMVDDVVALLDYLKIRRAHFAGHSMGALLAGNLGARFPDRVASLTLVAGPFYPDRDAWTRFVTPHADAIDRGEGLSSFMRAAFPDWSDSAISEVDRQSLATNPVPVLSAVLRSFPDLTLTPADQPAQEIPALVIVGTRDAWLRESQWIASWWPGSRLVVAPGEDHATILEPEHLVEPMRQLVSEPAVRSRLSARAGRPRRQRPRGRP